MHNTFFYLLIALWIIFIIAAFCCGRYYSGSGLILFFFIFLFLLFFFSWPECYDVRPTQRTYQDYRNKVLWVNMDSLDVVNNDHTTWCKKLMIEGAPNKLGIYCDKYTVNKLDILRYKETFNEMFGYDAKHIYFANTKLSKELKRFCEDKNVKIKYASVRYERKF